MVMAHETKPTVIYSDDSRLNARGKSMAPTIKFEGKAFTRTATRHGRTSIYSWQQRMLEADYQAADGSQVTIYRD
jgi:hypothetical protein